MMDPSPVHVSVLVGEVISALVRQTHRQAVYLDCTVGMGGHTEAILKATAPYGRVIGMDRDEDAMVMARERLISFGERVRLVPGSFKKLSDYAGLMGLSDVAGILFDLGVSSFQLMSPDRGFSCRLPGPLDMRMDRSLSKTAADFVNTLREGEIADLIYAYGEEKASRKIARAIVYDRQKRGPITETDRLSDIVCRVVRKHSKHMRLHPATKTFQAFRIAVNDELGELEAGLSQAIPLLAVGGRLAVISFHSLEDRIVKQRFKSAARLASSASAVERTGLRGGGRGLVRSDLSGHFIPLYKKPVTPAIEEQACNPSARSAKLRVLERVA